MPATTIDEARKRTRLLEQLIEGEIRAYEDATGLCVEQVCVSRGGGIGSPPYIIDVSVDVRMVRR